MTTDLLQRGRGWRIWIAVLAIALVGATSASAVWHEEHAGDQGCAVCQLRHQPAAAPSGSFQFEPVATFEPVARNPRVEGIPSRHASSLPPRAPPA